jgi:tetratricopeptide (TPR) repeat protein
MRVRRRLRGLSLLLIMLAASLPNAPALAKGKTEGEEARRERSEGTVALNLGRYDEAAEHFEEAYALTQDPLLLFYLGQAYRLGGKPEKSLAAYNAYLRTANPGKNREQFERAAADIEVISMILLRQGRAVPAQDALTERTAPAATANKPSRGEKKLEPPPSQPEEAQPTEPEEEAPPVLALPSSAARPPAASETSARDLALVQAAPAPLPATGKSSEHFYKKWWFWSSVAGVAVVGGATAYLATRSPNQTPTTTWGSQRVLP